MQWDDSPNAGFTAGTPWLKVNPNYTVINAKAALEDPNSVFHYYRKLIALRKEYPVFVEGDFTLLEAEHPRLFVYRRTWQEGACWWCATSAGRRPPWQIPQGWAAARCCCPTTLPIREICCPGKPRSSIESAMSCKNTETPGPEHPSGAGVLNLLRGGGHFPQKSGRAF